MKITVINNLPQINLFSSIDILRETKQITKDRKYIDISTIPSSRTVNHTRCGSMYNPESRNNQIFFTDLTYNKSSKNLMSKRLKIESNDAFIQNFYEFINRNYNSSQKLMSFISIQKNNLLYDSFKLIIELEKLQNYSLRKEYFENDIKKVILILKPIVITFYNDNNKLFKLKLPFEFVTILSLLNYEEIIQFLSRCIVLKNNQICLIDDIIGFIKKYPFNISNISISNKYDFKRNLSLRWGTDEKIMNVIIRTPVITFKFVKKHIKLIKPIDINFLFYFYINNFENWEDYVLNDLTSNKLFRKFFNRSISRSNELNGKKVNVSKLFEKQPLNNNLDDNILYGIYTDSKNKNYFLKVLGYRIENRKKTYNNYIYIKNWKHNLSLIKLSKIINLENCINRRLKLNTINRKIIFDADWLEKITNDNVNFYKIKNDKISKNDYKIINPVIFYETFIDNESINGNYLITDEHIKNLTNAVEVDELFKVFIHVMRSDNKIQHIDSPIIERKSLIKIESIRKSVIINKRHNSKNIKINLI